MNLKEKVWEASDKVHQDLKLAGLALDGSTTDGTFYSSIKEMWTAELGLSRSSSKATATKEPDSDGKGDASYVGPGRWYERAYDYWEDSGNCSLNDDGVLGGYGYISPVDISGSAAFLDHIRSIRPRLGEEKAADCGGGIGRVTKHLLLDRFESVDIIEQSPRLLQAAPKYIGRERDRAECVCVGLQDFHPSQESYDLIWIQWVVGHFTDVDFIKLLRRCRSALKAGGLVVIKDNVVPVGDGEGAFKVDSEDSSLTRSMGYFRSLFNQAGVTVVHHQQQEGFPGTIFPVYMFALELVG